MTKRPQPPPTPREIDCMLAIRKHTTGAQGPSLKEIAEEMGLTSLHTVLFHLDNLAKKKLVRRVARIPRSIRLTSRGLAALEKAGEEQ